MFHVLHFLITFHFPMEWTQTTVKLENGGAAPKMADHSDEQHSFRTITTAFIPFIGDDDSDDSGSEFVFNIEPTLLIDPHCLKIGEVMGEGSCSIVYEGLWVFSSLFPPLGFSFFLLGFSHCAI